MSDLIDRQAAIETLNVKCLMPAWCKVLVEKMLKDLPSAQPAPRWIPCSERLPKPVAPSQRREWFITSNQYGGVTLTCYEFSASPFKEGWQTDMTILAWMPLPEPYREADMR